MVLASLWKNTLSTSFRYIWCHIYSRSKGSDFWPLSCRSPVDIGNVFHFPFSFSDRRNCFRRTVSKNFIALLRLFLKIQNDQFAGKIRVKDPVLKIRWSEKDENSKFSMACVSLDPFPSFFEKYNKNSFLICLANFFSTLQVFEQFAVSEYRVGFVESRSVNTISLITTNQPTCLLSTSFWTAISHINALIAYSSPSGITSIVSYHTE